jgi:dihydrolipoamide dehydrogenase
MANTKLVVVGGGPGGYAAAFLAADLGMETTLVDTNPNPGGVCLYRGCIPSKAFLHVAKLLNEAREAENIGIKFAEPEIDFDQVRNWKESVVNKLTGGLGGLVKQRKINYIRGRARLSSATSLDIETESGSEKLTFEHAILATGSRPAKIPTFNIGSARIMDSTDALRMDDIPQSLLVVGGGYIGLELSTVYAALGSKVTVVEMLPGLLMQTDRDLVKILEANLRRRLHSIMLETKVVAVEEVESGIKVTFEGKDVKEPEQIFDKVLVSVGRVPNTGDIGLENTKITPNQRGFIEVDAQRRTVEPTIYAIGDIAGDPMLAHKASHEGRIAVEAIAGHPVAYEPAAIPAVVFTDPEIAWTGITEMQAEKEGRAVKVAKFPWGASGRATTLDRSDGLTKLIIDPETERLLGVAIAGPGAGELISEGTLAIEMAALASDVKLTIHPHPTLSETVMESAEVLFGQATHVYRPKK